MVLTQTCTQKYIHKHSYICTQTHTQTHIHTHASTKTQTQAHKQTHEICKQTNTNLLLFSLIQIFVKEFKRLFKCFHGFKFQFVHIRENIHSVLFRIGDPIKKLALLKVPSQEFFYFINRIFTLILTYKTHFWN